MGDEYSCESGPITWSHGFIVSNLALVDNLIPHCCGNSHNALDIRGKLTASISHGVFNKRQKLSV